MLRLATCTWLISNMVLSSRATAVEGPLSCPCSHKKCVVVWYIRKCWQPRNNSLILTYVNIRMHMVDKMYMNMSLVLQDIISIAAVTAVGLVMYKDISFVSLSCLKHKNSNRMNATRAMTHDTNINIMLDSASSSKQESISKSSSAPSMFYIIDSLKSLLSLHNLTEFDKYIVFFFILPMRLSNWCKVIAEILFSV